MEHRRGVWLGLLALAVSGLLLTACSNTADPPAAAGQGGASSDLLGHVHGVGVDPADGTVYVATHHGLFRLSSAGRLDPVGSTRRDLMGFTIAGPRTFLSSGHPAPGERTPNPLGLVESRDAGNSWTTLSLSGQSDFHALDAAGSTVYGYDGSLKASIDGGRSWQTRGGLAAIDIAANPRSPDMVVATTERGVAASVDGGRTFGPPRGPVLVFVAWSPQGTIYGLAPDGAVHTSTDGTTWTKAGTVPGGRPQALGATGDGRVLAATAGGIVESRDGGRTFTKLA